MKILLIDDEHRKAEPLVSYMEFIEGWSVLLASGPKSAVDLLADNGTVSSLDLIILDIMMDPEGVVDRAASKGGRDTGLLMIDEILKLAPQIPLGVYTARIDLEDLAEDQRVRFVLQKPCSVSRVVSVVRSIVHSESGVPNG